MFCYSSIFFYNIFCNQSFFISPFRRERKCIACPIHLIQGQIREASLIYLSTLETLYHSPITHSGTYTIFRWIGSQTTHKATSDRQRAVKLDQIRFMMVGLSVSGYAPFKPSLFCVNKTQESFAIICPLSHSYINQIDMIQAKVGAWGSILIAERFLRDTSLRCPFS